MSDLESEIVSRSEELYKRFDPRAYERAWQRRWAESGIFRAAAPSTRRPFSIVIPPPNVTCKLHVGHALQTALEDLLTRWRRMSGDNALWLPGTDHAGISTQLMVERQLAAEGMTVEPWGTSASSSTRPATGCTISSGAISATGTSSSPSPRFPARHRGRAPARCC